MFIIILRIVSLVLLAGGVELASVTGGNYFLFFIELLYFYLYKNSHLKLICLVLKNKLLNIDQVINDIWIDNYTYQLRRPKVLHYNVVQLIFLLTIFLLLYNLLFVSTIVCFYFLYFVIPSSFLVSSPFCKCMFLGLFFYSLFVVFSIFRMQWRYNLDAYYVNSWHHC